MIRNLIIATTALTFMSAPVFAADTRDSDDVRVHAQCKADFNKLCKNTAKVKGLSRMGACFKAHETELSDGCKTALAARNTVDTQERDRKREAARDKEAAAHPHKKPPVEQPPQQTTVPVQGQTTVPNPQAPK